MPQINRIRVNNVKYNFGTQMYDDFMMRPNCSSMIYDLANGGGKSLLMLMLLQNVIPNCTLDEKQPVEKLFRQGGGNTVIHSLVEWKLEPCYRKDNYTYMTTGFCARKAGAQSNSSGIEYFNYAIFYREFGDNDIKNLPLTSNGERITYNGLKEYLRNLEKDDFNVSVKIFDRKGDYQNFLSHYGIYESQWEIIRGINKTEGHVRTYFESNYRTSRKVVEDLLIEEIIDSQNMRVPTGVLNEILTEAVAMQQPPSDKGKRLRIYYITQVSVKPPTFVMFVNDKQLTHFSYTRYIENKIREAFGFRGTSIRFINRERKEKE